MKAEDLVWIEEKGEAAGRDADQNWHQGHTEPQADREDASEEGEPDPEGCDSQGAAFHDPHHQRESSR
jgi:hypothetical protein